MSRLVACAATAVNPTYSHYENNYDENKKNEKNAYNHMSPVVDRVDDVDPRVLGADASTRRDIR
jgi:hypothetical protein